MDQQAIAGDEVGFPHAPNVDTIVAPEPHAELHVNNVQADLAPLEQPVAEQDANVDLAQQLMEDAEVIAAIHGHNPGAAEQETPRVAAVIERVQKLDEGGQRIKEIEEAEKKRQRAHDKEMFRKTKEQEERKRRDSK